MLALVVLLIRLVFLRGLIFVLFLNLREPLNGTSACPVEAAAVFLSLWRDRRDDVCVALSRYPRLFVDDARLRHTLGWQRWTGFDGPACFAVCRLSDLAGINVIEQFPLTEPGGRKLGPACCAAGDP